MVSLSSCLALSLLLHTGSVHTQDGYNNFNPGLGVSCTYTENVSFSTGVYYNSERRMSAYASAEYSIALPLEFRAGVVLGAVTGYKRGPVIPTAALVLHSPEAMGIRASIVMVPETRFNSGVAHLVLSRGF